MEPVAEGRALTPETPDRLAEAERILGHRFRDPGLLAEALTHRSATRRRGGRRGAGSNERLEFIGDRVLGLLMAEWLLERFPDEQEGELGPRHADLVSRTTLARIAGEIGLAGVLAVAPNEARAGVGQLSNVLADGLEAALGALYLDGGLEAARGFVRRAWAAPMLAQLRPPKDPKTALQEWLLGRGLPLPVYEVAHSEGPSHAPRFLISARAAGKSAEGEAGSKRAAERLAAARLLELLS